MGEVRRYRGIMTDSARWRALPLRPGDIVVSPPGKCGTTWMQMLCALLVFGGAGLDRPLSSISPWVDDTRLGIDDLVAVLDAQSHRRFLKSHTPLDGLPFREDVTYLCVGRDPRDVAISFEHHMANLDPAVLAQVVDTGAVEPPPEDPAERFWAWADEPFEKDGLVGVNLAVLVHHVRTFWDRRHEPNVALFHYQDLLTDLPGQLRRLAGVLGIEATDDQIAGLAAAATFERMRDRADELAPHGDTRFWRDNRGFFRSGTSGQWRDRLSDDDVRRYEARLAELAPAEVVDWLHHGWRGAAVG